MSSNNNNLLHFEEDSEKQRDSLLETMKEIGYTEEQLDELLEKASAVLDGPGSKPPTFEEFCMLIVGMG